MIADFHITPFRFARCAVSLFQGRGFPSDSALSDCDGTVFPEGIAPKGVSLADDQLPFSYHYFGEVTQINPLVSASMSDFEKNQRILAIYHQTGNFKEQAQPIREANRGLVSQAGSTLFMVSKERGADAETEKDCPLLKP